MYAGASEGQKRVLDSLDLEWQLVVSHLGCRNADPLQEQQTLLAAEPFLDRQSKC